MSQIEVKVDSPTAARAEILNCISIHQGDVYHDAKGDETVKALYEFGRVQDVRLIVEPAGLGVKLVYLVELRGLLR